MPSIVACAIKRSPRRSSRDFDVDRPDNTLLHAPKPRRMLFRPCPIDLATDREDELDQITLAFD
jgi:hypothetical protein